MAPRPKPQHSLFSSDEDVLSHAGSSSTGLFAMGQEDSISMTTPSLPLCSTTSSSSRNSPRSHSRSSLTLDCGSADEVWQDELLLSSLPQSSHSSSHYSNNSSIERTMELDPLLFATEEDEACKNDSAIAARMAAEWGQSNCNTRGSNCNCNSSIVLAARKPAAPATLREKVAGVVFLVGVVGGIVGLALFAVTHGSGGRGSGSRNGNDYYTCPASLRISQLVRQVRNASSFCGDTSDTNSTTADLEVDCQCQSPLDAATDTDGMTDPYQVLQGMEADAAHLAASIHQPRYGKDTDVDVVFLGQDVDPILSMALTRVVNDTNTNSKTTSLFVGDANASMATLQSRFLGGSNSDTNNGLVTMDLNPLVWWFSVGRKDLLQDQCSQDAVMAGIGSMVERIVTSSRPRTRSPTIVLAGMMVTTRNSDSIITDDYDAFASTAQEFNARLECLASTLNKTKRDITVEYFHPDPTQEDDDDDDDDDFFLDVNSGGSKSSSAASKSIGFVPLTPEEASQAILDKLDGMI